MPKFMELRLFLLLVIGASAIIGVHRWDNQTMKDRATAIELAVRATKLSHTSIDEAILLIEQATAIDKNNPSIWYDASGFYAVKAMTVFTKDTSNHFYWVEKAIDAAREADRLSEDWFYTKDLGDTLLFAHMYGYTVDLSEALMLYMSVPPTGSDAMDRNMAVRVRAVERVISDRKEFFNEEKSFGTGADRRNARGMQHDSERRVQ